MNEERENVDQRFIDSGTNIRIPIGAIVILVLSIATVFWNKIEYESEKRRVAISELSGKLGTKADKTLINDRYTGADAATQKEFEALAHAALQREFIIRFEAIYQDVLEIKAEHNEDMKHMHSDIVNHKHHHSEIDHNEPHE